MSIEPRSDLVDREVPPRTALLYVCLPVAVALGTFVIPQAPDLGAGAFGGVEAWLAVTAVRAFRHSATGRRGETWPSLLAIAVFVVPATFLLFTVEQPWVAWTVALGTGIFGALVSIAGLVGLWELYRSQPDR